MNMTELGRLYNAAVASLIALRDAADKCLPCSEQSRSRDALVALGENAEEPADVGSVFHSGSSVPTTDAEAEEYLRYGKSHGLSVTMIGLFYCRREAGDSLLRAYETALLAFLAPAQDPMCP